MVSVREPDRDFETEEASSNDRSKNRLPGEKRRIFDFCIKKNESVVYRKTDTIRTIKPN